MRNGVEDGKRERERARDSERDRWGEKETERETESEGDRERFWLAGCRTEVLLSALLESMSDLISCQL